MILCYDNWIDFALRLKYTYIIAISGTSHNMKVGDCMGMTNKQFQGFIRLALELINKALTKSPDNEDLQKLRDIFQSMLEDGN